MNWHGDEKENERTQDAQEMSQKCVISLTIGFAR